MSLNPADPMGGYEPFFSNGYANPHSTLVERGVLKNLTYRKEDALGLGRPYSDGAVGLRVEGGKTSVEEMIANCKEGVLVNNLSNVSLVHLQSMTMTGVTRDGCFLIKDGKIAKPIKNFRFLDSPAFMLNKLVALGETRRASFGYAPSSQYSWPRRPMIVPPMMVTDFNFSALVDAV